MQTKSNRAMLADLTSISGYSTVSPHFKDYQTYLQSYKEVPFVRPCVSAIAYNCSNITLHLVPAANDEDDTDGEVTRSPLLDLLKKPNPYQTGFELREMMFTDLELTGNCFISLEAQTGRGLPTELYRLQPDHVIIKGDPRTGIASYVYTANGRPIPYAPTEIWHQRYPHPFDPLYGMGTVEAMETRADSAKAMSEHEARFWQSGAKITGVLSTDTPVDETIFARLKNNFREFIKNSGFSTLILEQGLKYTPVSESLAALGLLEIHHMSRDEILAMFGVPPTKVGIIESANYKAQAADQFFWTETLDPKLTRNEQAMQTLVDLFHPGQNLKLRYDRVDFSDDAAQATVAESIQKTYSWTINELREYQGKEPVPMGDVILIAGRGAPIAIDPVTGQATVLGGPDPGEVTVDESNVPATALPSGIAPAVVAVPAVPAAPTGPTFLPNAQRKMAVLKDRAQVAERLRLTKADMEQRAATMHLPAVVQAFYAQEQRVKDALKKASNGSAGD